MKKAYNKILIYCRPFCSKIRFAMKKNTLFILLFFLTFVSFGQLTTDPSPIIVDQEVTITIDANSNDTNCNGFNNPTKVYLHAGIGDDNNPWGFNVIGNWGQDDGVGEMSSNGDGTWSITLTPEIYFGLTETQASQATKMGMVFRNEDGSQELKATDCGDFFLNVGAFQVTMINPPNSANGLLAVENGGSTQILATNSNGNANYELFANGVSVHTQNDTSFYNGYLFTNLQENQECELVVTQGSNSISKFFTIYVDNTVTEALPENLSNGINYNEEDATTAILVLEAPNKDFVYVIGSFNNWEVSNPYAMKKDDSSSKFWVELTGLTPGENYTYQYLVGDYTDVPTNSSPVVTIADPYSTTILDPNNDIYIPSEIYPNLPSYPSGAEGIVSLLNTQEPEYSWQVTNFSKPDQENLIIYELLIRDFTDAATYSGAISQLDYLESLGVNAVELMPINEFEGNISWGYNPSFYMALDKAYGTKNSFKEFVDECHERGIAVIVDVVFNHSFGQSPLVQMYWDNANGIPATDNPYYNQYHNLVDNTSAHWGYDFNHESDYTVNFFNDVLSFWMNEYQVDGFRFDFTKGLSNTLYYGADNWASAYDASRIANLKAYADHVWANDPENEAYVIFEHLSDNSEETELANYGIMLWGNMNYSFNENTLGWSGNTDISWASYENRGWNDPNLVVYMESHDEERLMYKNLQFGNSNGSYNVTELNTALDRQEAATAIFYSIPGPKMIWQFGEMGYDYSINYCPGSGTIDDGCRLEPKPDIWTLGYNTESNRLDLYNVTAEMINLKKEFPTTFNTDNYVLDVSGLVKRINLYDTEGTLDAVVVANFDVTAQTVNPNFPSTGVWYEFFTGNNLNVTNPTATITLEAGEYRLYTQTENLSTDEFLTQQVQLFPNPTSESFQLSIDINEIQIYDLQGKIVLTQNGALTKGQQFDISSLSKGMYIVKVSNNSGQLFTTKLIKN